MKYIEEIPENKSLWNGECFVFDYRVSVDHELNKGSFDMCFACRMPLSEEDKKNKFFDNQSSMYNISIERIRNEIL